MSPPPLVLLLLPAFVLAAGCAASQRIEVPRALQSYGVDVQLDPEGAPAVVAYRIPPSQVPAAVRAAMDARHPAGELLGAGVVLLGEERVYELARSVDGRRVEARFAADGLLIEEQLELDALQVPSAVQESVRRGFPRGTDFRYELLRNGRRELIDYRVSLTQDGLHYQAAVWINGHVHAVWRTLPGELLLPVEVQ